MASDSASEPPRLELYPHESRRGRLFGTVMVALALFGLVGLVVLAVYALEGRGMGATAVLLSPFILVGVWALYRAARYAMELLNPWPTLFVSRRSLPPGSELTMSWRLHGRSGALQNLQICLVGREQAVWGAGTDVRTFTEDFTEIELVHTLDRGVTRAGTVSVQLPSRLMHSFATTHNSVTWVVRVRGVIPRWPDLDEEFPFTIEPQYTYPRTGLR